MKYLYFMPKGNPRLIYMVLKWSSLSRYVATCLAACLLILVWWFLQLQPLYRRILKQEQYLIEAQKECEAVQKFQENIKNIEMQHAVLQAELRSKTAASFVADWTTRAVKAPFVLLGVRTYKSDIIAESQHDRNHDHDIDSDHAVPTLLIEFTVRGAFEALLELIEKLKSFTYPAQLNECIFSRRSDESLLCTFTYKFYL